MAYKDLLVHLNNSKHRAKRLDIAIRLAQASDAHLVGLYTATDLFAPALLTSQLAAGLIAAQRGLFADERNKAKAEFEERGRKAGISIEWREVEEDSGAMATLNTRYADLAVIGQPDPDEALSPKELDLAERVVLDSGRPILMVPYAGRFPTLGQRVLIAWNASAQATRAVNDALPLLAQAKAITVLAVNPRGGERGHGEVPGADIALHLARHGLKAEAAHAFADDIDASDVILSRASDLGVNLIVMGAYGRPRLRELVLGGVTRSLFQHMTVPVLMSH